MKTPAMLLWFLATLVLCGLTGWEAYRKGKESLGREQMMDIIEDNRAAMQEVRHAYTDFSRVINVIRILDQQRITEGEQRREEMQKAVQGDTCASAYPPAAVTEHNWHTIAFRFAGNNSTQVTPVLDGVDGKPFMLSISKADVTNDTLRVTDITYRPTYTVLIDSLSVVVNQPPA